MEKKCIEKGRKEMPGIVNNYDLWVTGSQRLLHTFQLFSNEQCYYF
jgi:hypothetical protein